MASPVRQLRLQLKWLEVRGRVRVSITKCWRREKLCNFWLRGLVSGWKSVPLPPGRYTRGHYTLPREARGPLGL